MSGGRAGIPLDLCVEQIAAGDPYWAGPRGEQARGVVLRQIAAEWREYHDADIERIQRKQQFESECG